MTSLIAVVGYVIGAIGNFSHNDAAFRPMGWRGRMDRLAGDIALPV